LCLPDFSGPVEVGLDQTANAPYARDFTLAAGGYMESIPTLPIYLRIYITRTSVVREIPAAGGGMR